MTESGDKRHLARRDAIKRILGGAGVLGLSLAKAGGVVLATEESLSEPPESVINAEGPTSDSKAALAVSADDHQWAAWHAYHRGRDRVIARRIGPGRLGPAHVVSEEGHAHTAPLILTGTQGSVWVFWSALQRKRWTLLGRQFRSEAWQPIVQVSGIEGDALLPAAADLGGGRVMVTWSDDRNGRSRIHARVCDNGKWQGLASVSPDNYDAFRSALAVEADGTAWVLWDGYSDGRYAVWGRRWLPKPVPVEHVSPPGQNCLLPTALATKQGLCVVWLQAADVISGAGVISQRYTLHMAVRRAGKWELACDAQGDSTAALLMRGLVEKIEPEAVPTGGYLGQRRQAMLLEDGDAVWLFWERKTDHEGRTPDVTGDLLGRPLRNARWQAPVILRQGHVDYHVQTDAGATGGTFLFLASNLPRDLRRVYHCLLGDLRTSRPLDQEPWTGWRPLELPKADPVPRYEIRQGNKTYRLFWGDLHCHSHLSLDAEGEPDELLHYARDRARLDVVAFTENDCMYDCFLTEAAFALGVYYARRFNRDGRFVVLPGFEWTSRIPKSPKGRLDDPRNWDSRYYGTAKGDWARTASGTSYQNHRSVIYPMAGGPVLRHPEVGNDIQKLLAAVAEAGGLAHPHHDVWKLSGSPIEANVEVTSGWDVYIRDPERIHEALSNGYRFGFLGNSDNHRRTPGLGGALTGIYAESLTPAAILDALRNRRVYTTSGSRIIVDSRANGALMGQEAATPSGQVDLECTVIATRPIVEATLVRDGQKIKKFGGKGTNRLTLAYRDQDLTPGTHWYYWHVIQEGESPDYPGNVKVAEGPLAWSSPHWVTAR